MLGGRTEGIGQEDRVQIENQITVRVPLATGI